MKSWCLILGLLLFCGCSPKPSSQKKAMLDLKILGLEYHNVVASGFVPQTPEQLSERSRDASIALADGNYVMLCGLNLKESKEPTSSIIIGYHKDTPQQGGYALYGDGSVELLTKSQFDAAEKFSPEKKTE